MKTQYKYIHFEKWISYDNKEGYGCYNTKHKQLLGDVSWDSSWKQYTFDPEEFTSFSADCLDDVSHFLRQLNEGVKP